MEKFVSKLSASNKFRSEGERAKEERSKIKDVRKKCCLIFFFFWMGNISSLPQEKERTTGKTKQRKETPSNHPAIAGTATKDRSFLTTKDLLYKHKPTNKAYVLPCWTPISRAPNYKTRNSPRIPTLH